VRRLVRVVREKIAERRDVTADSLPEKPESTRDALSRQRHSPAERYRRGECQVWVWLHERRVIEDDRYYLIVFDRLTREFHCGVGDAGVLRCLVPREACFGSAYYGGSSDELSVFVADIEVGQQLHDISDSPGCRSFVRLYVLNHRQRLRVHSAFDAERHGPTDHWDSSLGSTRPNGEVGLGRGAPSVGDDQLHGKMVEGAPQIVDTVSRHESPPLVIGGRIISPVEVLLSTFLDLGDETVGLVFKPLFKGFPQFLEMEVRSLDLDVDAVERGDLAPPLASHLVIWEEDAEEKRQRADTGDSARQGRAGGNPDPDAGRGLS